MRRLSVGHSQGYALPVARALVALGAAALVAACHGEPGPSASPGVPAIQYGNTRGFDLSLDLGAVLVNSTLERTLELHNFGLNTLVAAAPEVIGGADALSVEFHGDPTLIPGEVRTVSLRFTPHQAGPYDITVKLAVPSGHPRSVSVRVLATGIALDCSAAPQVVDFGNVPTGTEREMTVRLLNPTDKQWLLTLGTVVGPGFVMRGIESGEQRVWGRSATEAGELAIKVAFAPEFYMPYEGVLELPLPDACGRFVRLRGTGVERVLFCDSQLAASGTCGVDFGATNPGRKRTKPVVFRNIGGVDAYVTYTAAQYAPGIGKPFGTVNDVRRFRIPAGGAPTEVPLEFKPESAGDVQTGTMTFRTTDQKTTKFVVTLRGIGGGPWIATSQSSLEFNEVAFQTAKPRTLDITNIGHSIPGDKLESRLRFVTPVDAGWAPRPPEVVDSTQFTITMDLGVSRDGLDPGVSTTATVRYAPTLVGPQHATLRIYSNDPEQPTVDVMLNGTGVPLPPCDYEVNPASLEFGAVLLGQRKEINFAIVNRSPNPAMECLVGDLMLDASTESAGVFTLMDGNVVNRRIAGGSALVVPLRYVPGGATRDKGNVQFYVSNPLQTMVTVPLAGTGAAADQLTVRFTPAIVDFGSVSPGCNTRERTVTLTNSGSTRATIESITVKRNASNAFRLGTVPTLPLTLDADSAASFGVIWRPLRQGADSAHVVIKMTGRDPLVVPLVGDVDGGSAQRDHFTTDVQPRLDLLLVVDTSASMASKAARLSGTLQALADSALLQRFDYQIGVTTAGASGAAGDSDGVLLPLAADATRPRILNRATGGLAAEIMGRLGTSWASVNPTPLRAAKLALSPPLALGDNVGLVRPGADLAVVFVTDATDADTAPIASYLHAFEALKGDQRDLLTVSGIIPTLGTVPADCSYATRAAGAATRYRDLIRAANGVAQEICSPNWTDAIAGLLDRIYRQRTAFVLRGQPVQVADISVVVDGEPVPRDSGHNHPVWDFDPALNAVVFDPAAALLPGSDVEISYRPACL